MTPPILVLEPKNRLEITPSRYPQWRAESEVGADIIWNREGQVRVVPCKVLREALHLYAMHHLLVEAGRAVAIPEYVRFLYWEQTDAAHR